MSNLPTSTPVTQAQEAYAVTPNNSTNLAQWPAALYVGGTGDVRVDMANGGTVTFVNVPDGTFLPILVKKVYVTGTDATDIIALL
jgi:hypothetical protein